MTVKPQLKNRTTSLRESRALRPGEGPPRPLLRPTLPLRGRVNSSLQKLSFLSMSLAGFGRVHR